MCKDEIHRVKFGGRTARVVRIFTRTTLPAGGRTLADLAIALQPDHWADCNEFFCDLVWIPPAQHLCPGASAGELDPSLSDWHGCYLEKVGKCTDKDEGMFPGTYLCVTWHRDPELLLLNYELAPGYKGAKAIDIDAGFVSAVQFDDTFIIDTEKWLRFNEDAVGAEGIALAQLACEMGWLDTVLTMVHCSAKAGDGPAIVDVPVDEVPPGLDEPLEACGKHLEECIDATLAQAQRACAKLKAGTYTGNDFAADVGTAATRNATGAAQSLAGGLALVASWLQPPKPKNGRGYAAEDLYG
jgi:hypothetical protein